MAIDFTDPAQIMNHGQRIAIDTEEAFMATREAAITIYTKAGRAWDDDAAEQLERRVRNGLTPGQIVALTLEDRNARFDE